MFGKRIVAKGFICCKLGTPHSLIFYTLHVSDRTQKGGTLFLAQKKAKKTKKEGGGQKTDRKGHGQRPKAGILPFTLATPLCIVGCSKPTKDVAGVGRWRE